MYDNYIYPLRKLELEDAPFMLEWMKGPEINKYFRFNDEDISINSLQEFIMKSYDDEYSKHFAIAPALGGGGDTPEYLGTVSLKKIDADSAEYAISLRKKAQGKGLALLATRAILEIAFSQLFLSSVYLNVLSNNAHAIAFYEKFGFKFVKEEKIIIKGNNQYIKWFRILRGDYENN